METATRVKAGDGYNSEGVSGLKALGVRDLNYRLSFLACSVQSTAPAVRKEGRVPLRTVSTLCWLQIEGQELTGENMTAEDIRKTLPDALFAKIAEMSHDRQLYQHLINSLFPSIFGE